MPPFNIWIRKLNLHFSIMMRNHLIIISLLFSVLQFQSCTNTGTCSISIGNSTIEFLESSSQTGFWRINSIICDYNVTFPSSRLNASDYFVGSCSELGDTDTELYYQFLMGTICYPTYIDALRAKANLTMTSAFDLFTTR
jgi:hypothetical protein